MNKEIEKINVTEVEKTDVEIEKESCSLLYKAKTFAKKHGKKVATGAAVAVAGIAGYCLGRVSSSSDDYIDIDIDDNDVKIEEI